MFFVWQRNGEKMTTPAINSLAMQQLNAMFEMDPNHGAEFFSQHQPKAKDVMSNDEMFNHPDLYISTEDEGEE